MHYITRGSDGKERAAVDAEAELMQRAITLSAAARRRTAPNPWVGCVLVRDGQIVGEGATQPPGGPHAEIEALRAAAGLARGATAYVTLEPCAHHGRTPPCVDALVEAGVARVVVAIADPDRRARGAGMAWLREHGVPVDVGIGDEAARRLLAPYLTHRTLGRPAVVLKTAMSLDGRIAARDGSSRWITGAAARADAHELRADSQAVVVGAGTVLADEPALTVREAREPVARQPLRVLLDARGRVPAQGPLFDAMLAPTLVVTTALAPAVATDAWVAAGAKVKTVSRSATGHGVDLREALELLAGLGVLQALVEGGAHVAGALHEADLVDRLVAYVAPTVLGRDGLAAFELAGPATIADTRRFELVDVRPLGDDVRLEYERPPSWLNEEPPSWLNEEPPSWLNEKQA
jgi:diaminohydroxyphosphoribosylaminopyrimidine deaminase / 5-amino-6-(5-phosphoribosylamino)uracil reductase